MFMNRTLKKNTLGTGTYILRTGTLALYFFFFFSFTVETLTFISAQT